MPQAGEGTGYAFFLWDMETNIARPDGCLKIDIHTGSKAVGPEPKHSSSKCTPKEVVSTMCTFPRSTAAAWPHPHLSLSQPQETNRAGNGPKPSVEMAAKSVALIESKQHTEIAHCSGGCRQACGVEVCRIPLMIDLPHPLGRGV